MRCARTGGFVLDADTLSLLLLHLKLTSAPETAPKCISFFHAILSTEG